METKWIEFIEKCYKEHISLAGITSLFYIRGFSGLRYMELRKAIFKQCQRIESREYIKGRTRMYATLLED